MMSGMMECQKHRCPRGVFANASRNQSCRASSLFNRRESPASLKARCNPEPQAENSSRRMQLAIGSLSSHLPLVLGTSAIWLVCAGSGHAAEIRDLGSSPHFHPWNAIQDLASSDDFWENLGRYGRYFVTVLLGTAYTAIKPLGNLLKNPVTAGVVIVAIAGLYFFVRATLSSMLGVNQEPLELFG